MTWYESNDITVSSSHLLGVGGGGGGFCCRHAPLGGIFQSQPGGQFIGINLTWSLFIFNYHIILPLSDSLIKVPSQAERR